MKTKLLLSFVLVLATVTVDLSPTATVTVASAESCLDKVVPFDAFDGSVIGSGASGAFVASVPSVSTVAAGGATAAVTMSAGTVAAAAATFAVTVVGTCKFLDWVVGDGDVMTTPTVLPANDVAISDGYQCDALPYTFSTTWGPQSGYRCWTVTLPGTLSAAGSWYSTADVTRTFSGVTFNKVTYSGLYPEPTNPSTAAPWATDWVSPTESTSNGATGWRACYTASGVTSSTGGTCTTFTGINSFVRFSPYCTATTNIGGNCGRHPSVTEYFVTTSGSYVSVVYHPNPVARQYGWSRRLVTDVKCRNYSTLAETWVRAESGVYYDRSVSARASIPSCGTGAYPVYLLTQRVPTGVACATLGAVCYGTSNIVNTWTAPSGLTTGTPPAWVQCLTAGYTCANPATVSGSCVWGSFTVPDGFCDSTKQTGSSPATTPKATGTITPITYVPGTPADTSTGTTPTDPGTGSGGSGTVVVPIDPDGETAPRDRATLEGADCWGADGWGWFNPATWVLKPVKCALEWAFVPDSVALAAAFDDVTALRSEPPLQWVDQGVTYITGVSVTFATWATAGPACSSVLDFELCPRDWDTTTGIPGWFVNVLLAGLWVIVIVGIWGFF